MEKTFWTEEAVYTYPKLSADISVDTAVIGGGLAGVLAAESFRRRGDNVCIIEADKICAGESAKSSAIISFAHDYIYDRLISKHGVQKAKEYYELNLGGHERIRQLIKKYEIKCNYSKCGMYLFATTEGGMKRLEKEQRAYADIGRTVELADKTELPFSVKGALKIDDQGYLNPYKFVTGLCKALHEEGLRVYEGTRVTEKPKGGKLNCGGFIVTAKRFIVATHFPYIDAPGHYFLKMYQSRWHDIAFKTDKRLENVYEGIEDEGFEFRPVRGGVMCGGVSVRSGKRLDQGRYKIVEDEIARTFGAGEKDIMMRFAAQDCITFDLLPMVGRYGAFTENLYVITGFNKWGFTTAAAASEILAENVFGERTDNLFNSRRFYTLASPIKALHNFGAVCGGYFRVLFGADKKNLTELDSGEGAVIRRKCKRLGVYKRPDGETDTISAVCSHLGGGLEWNADELSWDCPCHGSRFDTQGNVISGPAVKKCRCSCESGEAPLP